MDVGQLCFNGADLYCNCICSNEGLDVANITHLLLLSNVSLGSCCHPIPFEKIYISEHSSPIITYHPTFNWHHIKPLSLVLHLNLLHSQSLFQLYPWTFLFQRVRQSSGCLPSFYRTKFPLYVIVPAQEGNTVNRSTKREFGIKKTVCSSILASAGNRKVFLH